MPDRVPKDGNILVAYSTLPNHKAYEKSDGGLWMKLLAEAVMTQNDDITVVLTEVSSKLKKQCQSYPAFQTPQYINQLTERINFLAESGKHNIHMCLFVICSCLFYDDYVRLYLCISMRGL